MGIVVEHRLPQGEEVARSRLVCSCRAVEMALAEDMEPVLRRVAVVGQGDSGPVGLVEGESMCAVCSCLRPSCRVGVQSLVAAGLARSLLGCM